jgi:phage gpG-like protein
MVVVQVLADDAKEALRAMIGRGENLLPVMSAFQSPMRASVEKTFQEGGRPEKWAPLAIGTMSSFAVSRKSFTTKAGFLSPTGRESLAGRRTLIKSGLLLRTIYFVPGPMSFEAVAPQPYAGVQQFGARIPPIYPKSKKALFWPGLAYPVKHTRGATVPPRPFLVFQQEDVALLAEMIAGFVATGNIR